MRTRIIDRLFFFFSAVTACVRHCNEGNVLMSRNHAMRTPAHRPSGRNRTRVSEFHYAYALGMKPPAVAVSISSGVLNARGEHIAIISAASRPEKHV